MNLMGKSFLLFFLLSISFCNAQTHIKVNGLSALVLMPNVAVETKIADKYTFQTDILASFWESINGKPFKILMITPEIRYHFKEINNGFYAGGHIGFGLFKLQKWNYTNQGTVQEGFNYYVGATIGFQKKISDKFMLDFYIGGGDIQSFYKAYKDGVRTDGAEGYNKSGEFLPYRVGVMFCYQLN
jgi:Protein of unknown function (DUF3575)